MAEIGLLDRFLLRPHDKVPDIRARVAGHDYTVADFSRLPVKGNFIAMMPQWEFLDFLAEHGRTLPDFTLRMNCEAVGLRRNSEGRITGVILGDGSTLSADLVIAADGRSSVLRSATGLPLVDLGAPIDVFWFRVPKARGQANETAGVFANGRVLALIDRGDYWQVAYVFPKGAAEAIRAKGLDAFRTEVATLAPELASFLDTLTSWDDVKLLSVSLNRLTRWHEDGFLAIGDAAHAMSPVGGVGINLAIQDAVAAANILADAMARGWPVDALLPRVARRRLWPTRVIQSGQKLVHDRIIGRLLRADARLQTAPLPVRLLDRWALLRVLPAWLIGLGVRREHVRSRRA